MIRVEIVVGRPVYLHGLVAVLTGAGMKVVSARSSLNGHRPWRADVLVLDPDVAADPGGEEAVVLITRATPVLMLTSGGQHSGVLATSVSGLVSRDADVDELVTAVHTVARGGSFPPPSDARPTNGEQPTNGASTTAAPGPARPALDTGPLSPRERQVLGQIAHGRTHGQIARALGISHHTVDTYVKRIRSKLDLGNKAELTRAAVLGEF